MRYLYIAGKWTEAADDGTAQTINPFDASPLDTLASMMVARSAMIASGSTES